MSDSCQPAGAVDPSPTEGVAALCPECGLCCSGVLFGSVPVQARDRTEALRALGFKLRGELGALEFGLPCHWHEGGLCGVYRQRPTRCQSFECKLLAECQKGAVTHGAALEAIHKTKRAAEALRQLLREAGQTDETLPLSRRYQRLMEAQEPGEPRNRGALFLAVMQLTRMLQGYFYTERAMEAERS